MIPKFIQDMELSKYNVLAVDDIPLNLLLVQKMLSKFNFRIRTATNGRPWRRSGRPSFCLTL